MAKDKTLYDVGYKKPPKTTRFKRGKSGNPKGRPPGKLSIVETLRKALNKPVHVRDGGKDISMSVFDAIFNTFARKAAAGDARALRALTPYLLELDRDTQSADPARRTGVLMVSAPISQEEWIRRNRLYQEQPHQTKPDETANDSEQRDEDGGG